MVFYSFFLRALAVCAAMTLSLASAWAHPSGLAISSQCKGSAVPTGVWYGVRSSAEPYRMYGLRDYYDRTVRRLGNIFGTDYCTFERHLVYANSVGAGGGAVNDQMTNLPSKLYMPARTEDATHWVCFRPNTTDAECPLDNTLAQTATLPNGVTVWEKRPAQHLFSTDELRASVRTEIAPVTAALSKVQATVDADDKAHEALSRDIRAIKDAQTHIDQRISAIEGKPILTLPPRDRSLPTGFLISFVLLCLVLMAVLTMLGFMIWDRRAAIRRVDNVVPFEARAASATNYEPGGMIPITIPSGLPHAGRVVQHEVLSKILGKNSQGYDYWVLPEHVEPVFAHLTPHERREKVLEKPREHLVLARNLPDHWKKCEQCRKALEARAHAGTERSAA